MENNLFLETKFNEKTWIEDVSTLRSAIPPWGHFSSKVVFHRKSSSFKGCLPLKAVFLQRLSSLECRLPSKVVFHHRLSFLKGRLPSKVIFHQRSSSIKGRLPFKVVNYHLAALMATLKTSLEADCDRQEDRGKKPLIVLKLPLCPKRIIQGHSRC